MSKCKIQGGKIFEITKMFKNYEMKKLKIRFLAGLKFILNNSISFLRKQRSCFEVTGLCLSLSG